MQCENSLSGLLVQTMLYSSLLLVPESLGASLCRRLPRGVPPPPGRGLASPGPPHFRALCPPANTYPYLHSFDRFSGQIFRMLGLKPRPFVPYEEFGVTPVQIRSLNLEEVRASRGRVDVESC